MGTCVDLHTTHHTHFVIPRYLPFPFYSLYRAHRVKRGKGSSMRDYLTVRGESYNEGGGGRRVGQGVVV